eukprot:gene11206-biopygen2958
MTMVDVTLSRGNDSGRGGDGRHDHGSGGDSGGYSFEHLLQRCGNRARHVRTYVGSPCTIPFGVNAAKEGLVSPPIYALEDGSACKATDPSPGQPASRADIGVELALDVARGQGY